MASLVDNPFWKPFVLKLMYYTSLRVSLIFEILKFFENPVSTETGL
jgi:hypothetical protein